MQIPETTTNIRSAGERLKMEMKFGEGKSSSPRREFRFSKGARSHQKAVILEAIAQFGKGELVVGEDGRMKIVVRKEDLKQVLEAVRECRGSISSSSTTVSSLEQRINLMRRRQILIAAACRSTSRGPWRPVLQSIPEEL